MTTTKREKELQSLRNRICRLEKLRDQAIRDLVMTESRLPALRKQAMRLRDRLLVRELRAQQVSEQFIHESASMGACDYPAKPEAAASPAASVVDDGLDIPAELDRSRRLQTLPDPRTPEKRAERRTIEKEKRDRELRGKTRRMPPSGKDALAAIRDAR